VVEHLYVTPKEIGLVSDTTGLIDPRSTTVKRFIRQPQDGEWAMVNAPDFEILIRYDLGCEYNQKYSLVLHTEKRYTEGRRPFIKSKTIKLSIQTNLVMNISLLLQALDAMRIYGKWEIHKIESGNLLVQVYQDEDIKNGDHLKLIMTDTQSESYRARSSNDARKKDEVLILVDPTQVLYPN
jgi:hypothetical protein